ncbi:hypothetical protein D1872_205170 [compost metagenome]
MNLFTPAAKEKIELVNTQLSRATIGFFRVQFILSLLTYILAWIGLSILNVQYALVLSLLIVIVDILPYFGYRFFHCSMGSI